MTGAKLPAQKEWDKPSFEDLSHHVYIKTLHEYYLLSNPDPGLL